VTTVHYEGSAHRLRIEGSCHSADRFTVQEALETFAQWADGHLIVDLTAVTGIDQSVADELLAAAERSRRGGGTFAFVRKLDSPDDEALAVAEQAMHETSPNASEPDQVVRRRALP
jgi:hypothetical protein